jgi:hypothetical protein
MRKTLVRAICLVVAGAAPVMGLTLTARDVRAAEGCECSTKHCKKAIDFCEWLICSDGTSKECNGEHVGDES